MSKKRIEDFIKPALALIPDHLEEGGKVDKVYKGYISSMGAAMIQSGVLPTLAIFSAKESGAEGQRWKLLRILTEMLRQNGYDMLPALTAQDKDSENRLLRFATDHQNHAATLLKLRRDLMDASVALKLTLRTFNLK
ncbi:MAG: type III-B CRISPR module-associated protein Cmr5 [Bacteroidia bacterium]|nr:type III-B CRISPR module-associated protein Cmr5 [Bacteroidia bacterium]